MNKVIVDYIQNKIIRYCWYHQFYEKEVNYNGKLILWKQSLLLVSKRWFQYITLLNDKYIMSRPYEFISNFKNTYSIYQVPPTHLEISSNVYVKLLEYLLNDQSRNHFFSNLQTLKFTFDSGYNNYLTETVSVKDFNYLFYNYKNIMDIEIKCYSPDGLSRKCLNTSNILECYIGLVNKDYSKFKEGQLKKQKDLSESEVQLKYNLKLSKLNLHIFGLDPKIVSLFKSFKLFSLKKFILNYYFHQVNFIDRIIDCLHTITQLEGLYIKFYSISTFDDMDVIINKLYDSATNNRLLKSLKEFKININSRSNYNDNHHRIYNTLIQLFKQMVNLNSLHLVFNISDFKVDKNQDLSSLPKVQLLQYLLNEATTITKLDTNLFDSTSLEPVISSRSNTTFRLESIDCDTNIETLLPLCSKDKFKVIISLSPSTISLPKLKELNTRHLILHIYDRPRHKNYSSVLNDVFSALIKSNPYLERVDIQISIITNLKINLNEVVIAQCLESFEKNPTLRYLSLLVKNLENSKQILNKINQDIPQHSDKLIWTESSIISYPGKTTVNRNVKLFIIKK